MNEALFILYHGSRSMARGCGLNDKYPKKRRGHLEQVASRGSTDWDLR
jgi:hypothetical protein